MNLIINSLELLEQELKKKYKEYDVEEVFCNLNENYVRFTVTCDNAEKIFYVKVQ